MNKQLNLAMALPLLTNIKNKFVLVYQTKTKSRACVLKFLFLYFLVLFFYFSSATASSENNSSEKNSSEKNLLLVLHGLNFKSEKMKEVADFWEAKNFEVSYLKLLGHESSEEKDFTQFSKVTGQMWEEQTKNWIQKYIVSNRKIVVVGFSLGAVSFLNALLKVAETSSIQIQGAVLYAPALSIHWYTKFPQFLWNSLAIPSANSKEYRVHSSTPVAAYKALYFLQNSLQEFVQNNSHAARKILNFPAVAFFEPQDELVSYQSSVSWIQQVGLSNWKVVPVSAKHAITSRKFSHLIIDSASVGASEWARMCNIVETYLVPKL